jgi:hypothetical protein
MDVFTKLQNTKFKIFTGNLSGARSDHSGSANSFDALQSDDILVVWSLGRPGRFG